MGLQFHLLLGNNGIFDASSKAEQSTRYEAAKETVIIKLAQINIDCVSNNEEFTLKKIKEDIKNSDNITIEKFLNSDIALIKYGVNENLNNLTGIIVSVNAYSEYKFLIGKSCIIEGIKTGEVLETTISDDFIKVDDFENIVKVSDSSIASTYTISFDSNGGTNLSQDKWLINRGEAYNSKGYFPTVTAPNGKTHIGWYTQINGGKRVTINEIPRSDLTLYAHYVDTETLFEYTGAEQSYTSIANAEYKIECWGAQGGNTNGGNGAYTRGNIALNKNEIIYIYVGQKPEGTIGGWNGGGNGSSYGGGGATDIRLVNGNWSAIESLASRIMVAAGGAGGNTENGGAGGAIEGILSSSSSR